MLSWRPIRRCLAACLALTLVLSGVLLSGVRDLHPGLSSAINLASAREVTPKQAPTPAPSPTTKPAAPAPVVHVRKTAIPSAPAGAAHGVVAELPRTRTTAYGMAGVTWSAATTATDVTVKLRSLVKGVWTPWQALELEDEDPGEAGRPGTEPIWVGTAQGVAVRVSSKSGIKPDDILVVTIDPGSSTSTVTPAGTSTDPAGGAIGVTTAAYTPSGILDGTVHASGVVDTGDGTPTFTPKPSIISRASWGAGPGTTCSAPLTGNSTHGVVVHHTAGSNSYAPSDSAKIVRGIQAYHVNGHGWCDIGYNFLVDKYGQIFEGRKGGTDRPVRGAHSGNFEVNTYDMGVSMMGNYDTVIPSPALKSSMVKLVGWRLGTNFLRAKGTYQVAENNLTLNMIAGHRNVISDVCPGRYGYAWLSQAGGMRDRVEAYISKYASTIKSRTAALGTSVTGPLFIGEAPTAGGRKARFSKVDMYSKTGDGTRLVRAAGGFRAKYADFGSQFSHLGFPTSDSPVLSTSGTYVQRFEHGSIFAMRSATSTTLRALWGPIATMYRTLGETTGKLGAPTTSVHTVTGGYRADFVHGYIRYTTSTNKTVAYNSSGTVLSTSTTTTATSTTTTATSTTTTADTLTVPSTGSIAMRGHGFGHGIGMGQYGAQEAAIKGVLYGKILATYYPGTTLATKTGSIRVLISQDTTDSVIVAGQSGLVFRNLASSNAMSLPTIVGDLPVIRWRIVPTSGNATHSSLQYRTTSTWHTYKSTTWLGDGQFENPSSVRLILPDGTGVRYRGALRSARPAAGSTTRNTVNVVKIESYVRGVVSAEMPSSWRPEALKAQAVAARTYGAHSLSATRYYDICNTTSCQVYGGVAKETATTDVAVAATAGKMLTYGGAPALTQFSSSSGGYTATGSQPYLKAVADPYDSWSGNPNHSWSTTVKASTLEHAYPQIGILKSLAVTKRAGVGEWGGRVTTLVLTGSTGSVTISGATARARLALKSSWFSFSG